MRVPARRRLWSLKGVLGLLLIALALVLALPEQARAEEDPAQASPRDIGLATSTSPLELRAPPADFQRIDEGGVTLEFPASVRSRVEALVDDVDSSRARLSKDLGQSVLSNVYVRVARGPDQMVELAPVGLPPYDYAAAMAYPSAHLILLSMQAPVTWEATDLKELVRHELAHLALDEAVAGHHVPLWFNEGLAMYESGEERWQRWRTLSLAAFGDRLLPLSDLDKAFPRDPNGVELAYAESADVVRFLARDADRGRFGSLVQRVRIGVPFDRAIEDAYSIDVRKLEYEWREDVKKHLRLLPLLTGGGMFGALTGALLLAAWVRRRKQAQAKLAEWAREEAESEFAVDATASRFVDATASRSITAQRLKQSPAAAEAASEDGPPRVPSMPVVEHEGRWYTLH
jgi:Peptidase MA superfamily